MFSKRRSQCRASFQIVTVNARRKASNTDGVGILHLVRHYLLEPWEKVSEELNRKKKPSRGRQKARDRPIKELNLGEDFGIVSPIS